MRVLQVNKLYPPPRAGVEVVVQDIAEDLAAAGDGSAVLASGRVPGAVDAGGVTVTRSRSLGSLLRMPVAPGMISDLRRLSREADVILLHHPFPLGFLAYLVAGRGRPLAVWYHADIVRQRMTGFLLRPLIDACLARARVILVASEALLDSPRLAAHRARCRVVPFGIDPDWATDEGAVATEAARIRGEHPGPLALHLGRLVSYKGLPVLLRAMRSQDATLLLVGDGPEEASLREQAAALGIADRVIFIAGPEDARPYFLACDVFVLPSVTQAEAFGLVQLEAMAYGKPVINTSLPTGVPEISLDRVTGITVPAGDAAALADALRTLLGDAELRVRYGTAGRKRVEERFSRAGFALAVRDALRAARNGRSPSA